MNPATLAPEAPVANKPVPVEERSDTLTAKDRCDKGNCSAAAFVRAEFLAGELLFCKHHYDADKTAIKAASLKVVDETWKLTHDRHKGTENS